MNSESKPLYRPAGRIILVDSQDRILLILVEDSSMNEPKLWITPGGACEDRETPEQAALRELWEETGIEAVQSGPCVWIRRHVWRWGERQIDSHEYFHFLRVAGAPAVTAENVTQQEQDVICEYHWWSVAELEQAADQVFVPRDLAKLLPPLLAGEFLDKPIEIGI